MFSCEYCKICKNNLRRLLLELVMLVTSQDVVVIAADWDKATCSHQRYSMKKVFLKILQKFIGKRMFRSLSLNEIKGWRPPLLNQRLRHKCFSCMICSIFNSIYIVEHSRAADSTLYTVIYLTDTETAIQRCSQEKVS